MSRKKFYCIEGPFNFKNENNKMRLEEEFTKEERHLQAYSVKQATFLFAKRFSNKLERRVYIGEASIYEVEPPEKIKSSKKKQLKLFDD